MKIYNLYNHNGVLLGTFKTIKQAYREGSIYNDMTGNAIQVRGQEVSNKRTQHQQKQLIKGYQY